MLVIRQKAYSTEEENKYIKEGANSPSMIPVTAGIGGGAFNKHCCACAVF
jgi:hypothetical protein